jgi:hypothetical protein
MILLARAIATLQDVGIWQIEDHVAAENFPMIHAFERAGYQQASAVDDLCAEVSALIG